MSFTYVFNLHNFVSYKGFTTMHMRLCILFVCLFLASISAVQRLGNLIELKNSAYGKHSPRHGLKLLFWLAQRITSIDQNNVFQVNLNLRRGDFGFHRFWNHEHILPTLTIGNQAYYSVGNIGPRRPTELPPFVTQDISISQELSIPDPQNNMDRLVVAASRNNPTRINRVFLTSHTYRQNSFEPGDTYEIDPQLIQQIRRPNDISPNDYNNYLLNTLPHNIEITENLRITFDDALNIIHEPGLAAFLVLAGYDVFYSYRRSLIYCITPSSRRIELLYQPQQYDFSDLKLEVRSTTKGYAKLIWENIPKNLLDNYAIQVAVCDAKQTYCHKNRIYDVSSYLDTSIALNPGLQPQLFVESNLCNKITFYGPVFNEANRVIPIQIKEFDVSLQLYTENGWACARLYINKTFSNWKDVFNKSWVGFYNSDKAANTQYKAWEYVVNFEKMTDGQGGDDYNTYQYKSNVYIAPGVQIRFLLDKTYDHMMAKTPYWEETMSTSQ